MAPNDGPPLSLRPFPVADKEPRNLADFITRVNAQSGGFRSVTEAKLHEEIHARQDTNGAAREEGVDMSDAADEDDAAPKDPNVARMEVLKNIDIAGNTAMLILDSLSLLLSKQNPTQAGLTLSQQLREMVGIGTLGADRLDEANTDEAKTKDQKEVALGWTLMEINRTRDAAEEAGSLLEREVEIESRYWEDVMAVKKAGWSLCRVPQERHTLGVRFGFSEASPEFNNNGLAPMRRSDDGSVELDLGRLGGVSEGLVVTYDKDGKVVGRSGPRRRTSDDPSLESRVLEARNTIFSQELWHELTRELRALAAYDVRLEGSRLTYKIDQSSTIAVELLPLASCPSPDDTLPESSTAEMISASLHLLLSYAHHRNELMRTRPIPPHVSRSRGQQHALLRPIIARMMSTLSIQSCTGYIGGLTKALQKAGLASSFTLHTPQLSAIEPGASGPNQPSGAQTLVRNMLQPLEFTVKLVILPESSLTIRGRTSLLPVTATYYYVLLSPSSHLQGSGAPYADGYSDLRGLSDYLQTAVARSLTTHFLIKLSETSAKTEWTPSVLGTSLRDPERENREVHFAIQEQQEQQDAMPALVLSSAALVGQHQQQRTWKWASEGPSESRTLEEAVNEVVSKSDS
ncbi:Mediator of RNA polymerase II transcription subunit 17 [Tolypocladium ophioglossoides CBS 100239]|uniref:Mediator of RNA polymerase II transcription subunit 17 n=1 Tax=Tolypocladium ophioglossoides (strain CBS 100239) TaxID=1163406 RepID=A0A0L0N706_TOLOC|nr:Mediator of RNA polymerase II transcription subunit 17 [Tolypocladium ophioglossoides CBS 100239]